MPIRSLADAGERQRVERAGVCVVGGGIAGLVAATRLAGAQRGRVIVLEAGAGHAAEPVEPIDNPRGNYVGTSRARGLGGSSLKWSGKLLPISREDLQDRPHLDLPGWPIDPSELDRYTEDIEALMGVDRLPYDHEATPLLDPHGLLPPDDLEFRLRWPKRPSPADHDIAHVLRDALRRHDHLDVWLGAAVTRFGFDAATKRLQSVLAEDVSGRSIEVRADEFLIAAGAHESTRLLLLADRQGEGLISAGSDVLGRFFNDHLGCRVARLRPIDARRTNAMFADRWPYGADRHLHLELRPAVQCALGIASAYVDFGMHVGEDSALVQARRAMQAARSGKLGAALGASAAALPDGLALVRTLRWSRIEHQKYWPPDAEVRIKLSVEQLPQRRNRLFLSEHADALGVPRLAIEYHKGDMEERTMRVATDALRRFWSRHVADVCALEWLAAADDGAASLSGASFELAHPAGSTRMGRRAGSSVVDTALRVHRLPNVSVASSSVFPSSGSANPTFTILQLAMRAADAIERRLRGAG